MKSLFKGCLTFLIFILIIIGIFVGRFIYDIGFRISDVDTVYSRDNQYEAKLQMIGEPRFPFGPATVRVQVYKNEKSGKNDENEKSKLINEFTAEIQDDGGIPTDSSWNVRWHNDNAVITLIGCEQEDDVHEVTLDN